MPGSRRAPRRRGCQPGVRAAAAQRRGLARAAGRRRLGRGHPGRRRGLLDLLLDRLLDHLPLHDFGQNQIWCAIVALACELTTWMQLLAFTALPNSGADWRFLYVLDVTDKQNRQTRFFISTRTLRVMSLEYTEDAVKYARKFYDYRYAQGTLVPYRTTLSVGDRQIEESSVSTITFGQKVEEDVFQVG